MLDKLLKQRNAMETQTGQTLLEMMRDFSEEQSANKNLDPSIIKGFQIMIQHVKGVKIRFEDEKARQTKE